jgi:hypothetical protein
MNNIIRVSDVSLKRATSSAVGKNRWRKRPKIRDLSLESDSGFGCFCKSSTGKPST